MSGKIRCGLALCLAMLLAACGGGGGGSDGSGAGSAASQVTSITFNPSLLAVAPGQQLTIIATAHFADGRTENVTSLATWDSSNKSVATLGIVRGIVVGVAAGATDITVAYAGFNVVAHLQVGSVLEAIDLPVPQDLGIGIGATYRFSATGQFTDGAFDVTKVAQWTSSDTNVAGVDANGIEERCPGSNARAVASRCMQKKG